MTDKDSNLTERRLEELEIQAAFQEDLLQTLNDTVAGLHRQTELLQDQLRLLYRRLADRDVTEESGYRLEDDIPPHY